MYHDGLMKKINVNIYETFWKNVDNRWSSGIDVKR